jgi:SAM-dependent methyltransferase
LDIFSHALVWKDYWSSQLRPYLGKNVLEVGAGTGTNTQFLTQASQERWVCLEPDGSLVSRLRSAAEHFPSHPQKLLVLEGTLRDAAALGPFDTIIYIDVLEHIEADLQEMQAAYDLLIPGGHIAVLSPAHQFLFTPFDEALGHYRRYSRNSLKAVGPPGAREVRLIYLDCIGFFASLGNKLFLQKSLPTVRQIKLWDRVFVRLSKVIDPLLRNRFGKSLLAVWQKPA